MQLRYTIYTKKSSHLFASTSKMETASRNITLILPQNEELAFVAVTAFLCE